MMAPTAEDVRTWSRVDFADVDLGYAAPVGADPDPLQPVVDRAIAYVTAVTARPYDDTCPTLFVPLMNQAAQMRTEQLVYQESADAVETAGDFDLIGSFSAGSYSETRRDQPRQRRPLNPWPALEDLLWLLLGLAPGETNDAVEAMNDWWRLELGLMPNPPAWALVEVDWRKNQQPAYGTFPWTGIDESLMGGGTGYHNPW
jgi:hypothetical protein